MNATQLAHRRKPARQARPVGSRPVPELLLEIAYRLHATRVVARPPDPTVFPDNTPAGRARR